ncbi:hypothetical protein Q669_26520 [Labrenzia sp. C1B10]|uniref:hypothetical protein n=1 Tax=unclassified Labrenzia TaxID=2648686 RepID=UPI0003B920B6|nr:MULTISPECIES: hypothetical protein [unclassified Labrenzia]ERP96799.1 hypothetical protein Q669_26520 [Labrenzia sp. C1B10]ERS04427.1 hypothetical protein Q675_29860 [Labrenzia sp. C1B70]
MAINRKFFYDFCRLNLFDGRLSRPQVEGLELILNIWEPHHSALDDRWLAYILGTAHHETGRTMQPVRETFANTDEQAIRTLERAWKMGRLPWVSEPYWIRDADGKCWIGRGFVQLTHKTNYAKMSHRLKIDLITNPDVAMQPQIAANILVRGMIEGAFTGRNLGRYFAPQKDDWRNARRIVNGLDKAELVASYARKYYSALSYTI